MHCRKYFAFFRHGIGSLLNSNVCFINTSDITSYLVEKPPDFEWSCHHIRNHLLQDYPFSLQYSVDDQGNFLKDLEKTFLLGTHSYLTSCWRRNWTASIIVLTEIFKPSYVCCETNVLFFAFLETLPSRCSME